MCGYIVAYFSIRVETNPSASLQKNTKVMDAYASLDFSARLSASKERNRPPFPLLAYLMNNVY